MTWTRVALRDIGQWYGGGTPSKSNPDFWRNGSVPWLSPKDMGPMTLMSTEDQITESAVFGSAAKRVPAHSVAVVVRSGILERTLPVAYLSFETTLNQDMKAVHPHVGIEPRWIAWGLRAFEQELLRGTRKAGTTVASIEMSRFQAFELPVPELSVQRRILAILEDHLSRLDAAQDSLQRVGRRTANLRRAWLQGLFDSVGEHIQLSELVQDVQAGRSFGGASSPAGPGEWGIIKVSAMTWGEFRPEENKAVPADQADPRFEIQAGDLLVSRANTNAYVGASVLVDTVRTKLLLSDKSLRVTPRKGVDREWLWRVLQTPGTRRQIFALATGTKDSMRNISQGSLLKVMVRNVPHDLQTRAVARFAEIDSAMSSLGRQTSLMTKRNAALRRAILAAAFAGRLSTTGSGRATVEELADA